MRMARLLVLSTALVFDLACSTVASNDDEAGVTTNQSSDDSDAGSSSSDDSDSSGTSATSTSTTTAASTSASTSASEDGPVDEDTDSNDDTPKHDIPFPGDLPMPSGDCTTAWLSWDQLAAVYPDCTMTEDVGNACWTEPMIGCTPPGPNGCACPEGDCIENWNECTGDSRTFWEDAVPAEVCGPYVLDGLCCSIGEFIYGCGE
jgi:hypothetical protein